MSVIDDIKTWIGLGSDVKTAVNKFNDAEKVMSGFLHKITEFMESIEKNISTMQTDIKSNLPKLEEIEKFTKQTKTAIDSVNTSIGSMHTTLNTAKNSIINMAGDLESLPDMAGDIGTVKTQMGNVKSYLSDIKTKIADNLPKLSKLEDLSKLDTINTSLNTLKSSLENLDFSNLEVTLPEDLKVNLDDSKIVDQLKTLNDKFGSLDTKLNILEKMNFNLERQNSAIEYGINLLTQNMPLTQNFFDFFNKISEINNLAFSVIKLETPPLEYFEKLNTILSQSLQWNIETYSPPKFTQSFNFENYEFKKNEIGEWIIPVDWPEGRTLPAEVIGSTLTAEDVLNTGGSGLTGGTTLNQNITTGGEDTNISGGNSNIGPGSSIILGGEGVAIDPATSTVNLLGGGSNIISSGSSSNLIQLP